MNEPDRLRGLLTPDQFGYSMPVESPLFRPLPFYYRESRFLTVAYETDPEAARALLPDALELSLPATASLSLIDNSWTTLGPCHEALIGILARWQDQPVRYVPFFLVDAEVPFAAGREIWGIPKKYGRISLTRETDIIVGSAERPAGVRLATAMVAPETPLDPSGLGTTPAVYLKVIPAAGPVDRPEIAELVLSRTEYRVREAWRGQGSVELPAASTFDPWHRLPVRAIKDAFWLSYETSLLPPEVIHRYH